jgi:hypothetical protein
MANETEIALREELDKVSATTVERIVDQQSYDRVALTLVKVIQPFRKRWAEYWAPLKKQTDEAHKSVVAKFREGDDPAARAELAHKRELRRWDDEQGRIKQELQAKAQREAEAREAADRAAQAAFAEEEGALEEAQAVVNAPSVAVAEPVPDTYQKVTGISKRDNWKCRVLSVSKLCKAIGDGKLKFAKEDELKIAAFFETLLAKRASAEKTTLNIPGVQAYNSPIISGRSRT